MNKTKSFSTLTSEDQKKMVPKGCAGEICFDPMRLPNKFPSEFFMSLSVLCMTLSTGMEIGRINAGNTRVVEPVRSTSVPHHLLSGTGADCEEVESDVDR